MKISRKILAIPFITTLFTGQICFAATAVSPTPTFTIDPSAMLLEPATMVTSTTTDTTTATPPPTETTVEPTTTTDPTGTTSTTDPNATTTTPTPPTATPPPTETTVEPTTTTDPTGTTSTTTPDPNGTTVTGTTSRPSPPPKTSNIPTEEPVIGILDVPLENPTQEQCIASETPICPSSGQVAKTLTPILTENQLKMSFLIFLGGGLGALLWIFAGSIMNGAQMKREEVRFDRLQRAANEDRRIDQLSKTYNRLSDTIASLYKESGNKLTLNKDALKNYLSSSIELEMYGSEESLTAHKQFLGMLTSGNSVTKANFDQAKNNLISSLKKDLGL